MNMDEFIRKVEGTEDHDIFTPRVFYRLDGKMFAQMCELLKEQEWKLITEDSDGILHGLPGDDGTYLMTDGKDIWIDEYVDGVDDGIFLDSGRDIREIKAWMYMPELPEQKGGEVGCITRK